MAVFDMPLEALRAYRGTNPRPADFDSYWLRALEQMRAVRPGIEVRESGFSTRFADCLHLTFTGVGGARVHAKYLRPRHAGEPHPAVLCFHGYSGSAGPWVERLAYAANGCSVFCMDCRGQGGQSQDVGGVLGTTWCGHLIRGLDDSPERLLYRQLFLDAAQLAGIAMGMPEVDPGRVGVLGQSQGGALALACAALEPRVKLAAPLFPFLSDYQRVCQMGLCKDSYQELGYYFRSFDPCHQREAEVFTRLGYIDIQHLAPRVRARVLLGTALQDTDCPPSTQFAVFNKLKCPKRHVIYPDYKHENIPDFYDKTFAFMQEL